VDNSPSDNYRSLHSASSTGGLLSAATSTDGASSGSDSSQDHPMQIATPSHAQQMQQQAHQDEAAGSAASHQQQQQQQQQADASMSANAATVSSNSHASTAHTLSSNSTPSVASSATSSSAQSSAAGPRYKPIRTLQQSLFGQVQLAYDNHRHVSVAVKVSHAALVAPKSNAPAPVDGAVDVTATARSQAGVSVLEDVRREARLLRLLLDSSQAPMSTATIDGQSCGLSSALVEAINLPANAVANPTAANPLSIQQQFLDSISKGKKSIAAFYDEVEAESYHYLISEYVPGGDLFSVLTAQPQHKVSEGVARQWMYQLCCAVRFLHANSVAHLDLSLENICLDEKGAIRLIDFGLAAQHPAYSGDRAQRLADGSLQRNASNHIRLLRDAAPQVGLCSCPACTTPAATLLENDVGLRAAAEAGVPLSKLKFLCRPICQLVHKPGKLGYLAPELWANQCWDGYKHDCFGLGVILYSMLTGRPPFTRPDEHSDVWFRVLYSGQWLLPQVRSQQPAQIYAGLSPNALHLIDLLIKPQHFRPTIDGAAQPHGCQRRSRPCRL
jgi:serine/threonine protein kinase